MQSSQILHHAAGDRLAYGWPRLCRRPGDGPRADYIIGAGDVLNISVEDRALDAAGGGAPRRQDRFPLIGQVTAAGKTWPSSPRRSSRSLRALCPEWI